MSKKFLDKSGTTHLVSELDKKYPSNEVLETTVNVIDSVKMNKEDAVGQFYESDEGEIFNDYDNNIASGVFSHAEGIKTQAIGNYAHSQGDGTIAQGNSSFTSGQFTQAIGSQSTALGCTSRAKGASSLATGGLITHVSSNLTVTGSAGTTTYTHTGTASLVNRVNCYLIDANNVNNLALITSISGKTITVEKSLNPDEDWTDHACKEGCAAMAEGYGSVAQGTARATGQNAVAIGSLGIASGANSFVQGYYGTASGSYAVAEGYNNVASGSAAHAEGYQNKTTGTYGGHSEGYKNTNVGTYGSHAEGNENTINSGTTIHIEGYQNTNSGGAYTHVEGYKNTSSGNTSHIENSYNQDNGTNGHVEGVFNKNIGAYSHIEGIANINNGTSNHIEGNAMGYYYVIHVTAIDETHFEIGASSSSTGHIFKLDDIPILLENGATIYVSNVKGATLNTQITSMRKILEFDNDSNPRTLTIDSGYDVNPTELYIFGSGQATNSTKALHIESLNFVSESSLTHAEGAANIILKDISSHIEGYENHILGKTENCHIEGSENVLSSPNSTLQANHIEGHANHISSEATGFNAPAYSHIEGHNNYILAGDMNHVEGANSRIISGDANHTEGQYNKIEGSHCHAEGYYTIAHGDKQHVQGKYNVEDTEGQYAHIVGGGTSNSKRKNIHTIDWDGNAMFSGSLTSQNQGHFKDILRSCSYIYGNGLNIGDNADMDTTPSMLKNPRIVLSNGSNSTFADGYFLRCWNTSGTVNATLNNAGQMTLSGSLTQGSDRSLKKNIEDISNSKEIIMSLKPKQYKLKEGNENDLTSLGFIAQDVDEILPKDQYDVVKEMELSDNKLALNYIALIAPLVDLVQQQEKRIAELEAEVLKK